MAARGLFPVAASLLVGLASSGCAESDASLSTAEYEELTHVVRARLSPCVSNEAFVPNWPTSRWQPPPSRSRAPALQINDAALISDGMRYYVHFADEGRAIYIEAVAGISGKEHVYGPLSLAAQCPNLQ